MNSPPRSGDAANLGRARHRDTKGQQRPPKGNPIRRADQAARPWRVIAVKHDGQRTVSASFPNRAAAERWAEMLRGFASWAGGDTVVEHDGRRP